MEVDGGNMSCTKFGAGWEVGVDGGNKGCTRLGAGWEVAAPNLVHGGRCG